jgi:formyltetrahydrofolate deformylase
MERGVKLLSATAHDATAYLDEGPIIGQGMTATSHRDSVADFVRRGREVEARVPASAVRAHFEHRVMSPAGEPLSSSSSVAPSGGAD